MSNATDAAAKELAELAHDTEYWDEYLNDAQAALLAAAVSAHLEKAIKG